MTHMELLRLPPLATVPVDHGRFVAPISAVSRYSASSSASSSPDSASDSSHGHTPDSDDDVESSPQSVVPKVEELDDQYALPTLTLDAKPIITDVQPPALASPARKRGRPRKHPIVEHKKITHARSKTGCGTCRKRKKKCDESKPTCMNCEKNNVFCDGYEPKQPWRPGKQKAPTQRVSVPDTLPVHWEGIECDVDYVFFDHFCRHVTKVLSLEDNGKNPFVQHIMPMTAEHGGLMHSVLYLSGTVLLASSPVENSQWRNRFQYHNNKALTRLNDNMSHAIQEGQKGGEALSSAKFSLDIAQTLILCLQTVCGGDTKGNFRILLRGIKQMLIMQKGSLPSEDLRRFILEFLLYHDHVDAMTNLNYGSDDCAAQDMEDLRLPQYMMQPAAGHLLGVFDKLFTYISRIHKLRVVVREQRLNGLGHTLQDPHLKEALDIEQALRDWRSIYPEDSPRHIASLLYRVCSWIYLTRTTAPSRPSPALRNGVDAGLELLRQLLSREDEESTQSILLMPLFLLGCAAFEPQQRPEIRATFQRLQDWSRLGNIKHAREVVEAIWVRMDQGLEYESWDWEQLMKDQNLDFLIT